MDIEAVFYDLPDGTEPANDFLQTLDTKSRAKMLRTIALLESPAVDISAPCFKYLSVGVFDAGIFELQVKVSADISRAMCFFIVGHRAIITHGFVKNERETPQSEIDRVRKYQKEYWNRMRRVA